VIWSMMGRSRSASTQEGLTDSAIAAIGIRSCASLATWTRESSDVEFPRFSRYENALSPTRPFLTGTRGSASLQRSRFRQFHSILELRWLVILDTKIGVIQRSDPFYLIVGELWAFRTRREFGELLFIVNVRER
jgi:hypothetical protein